jgi:hypothetical protein
VLNHISFGHFVNTQAPGKSILTHWFRSLPVDQGFDILPRPDNGEGMGLSVPALMEHALSKSWI